MNLRTLILLLVVLAIGALAALNWPTLSAPTVVSLGLTTVQAPLGLIMLALTALLAEPENLQAAFAAAQAGADTAVLRDVFGRMPYTTRDCGCSAEIGRRRAGPVG